MPVIRINADGDRPRMHSGTAPVAQALHRDPGDGPVIVMIHGWKYKPHLPAHCPHQHLFAFSPKDMPWRAPSWPRQMGFGTGHADEGLAIAFGWNARGAPWAAQASAVAAGRALALFPAAHSAIRPGRKRPCKKRRVFAPGAAGAAHVGGRAHHFR